MKNLAVYLIKRIWLTFLYALFCSENNNCLLDQTVPYVNITDLLENLPGEKYTPDEQCRIIFGEESFFCGVSVLFFF